MTLRPFPARLLYSIGARPAGTLVPLVQVGWGPDGAEYAIVGTPYRIREREFERVRVATSERAAIQQQAGAPDLR